MNSIKAVAFDLYGTLVYLDYKNEPYREFLQKLKSEYVKFKESYHIPMIKNFDTVADFIKYVDPEFDINVDLVEKEIKKSVASVKVFSQTHETIQVLKKMGYMIGVISNLGTHYKRPFYDLLPSGLVDHIIFSCDVGLAKPDPKIYLMMQEKLKLQPSQIFMVGDKPKNDVVGPISVGWNAILIDRNGLYPSQESIKNLKEICELI